VAIEVESTRPAPPVPQPDRLALAAAEFASLPGWSDDATAQAVPALLRSCARGGPSGEPQALKVAGDAALWTALCAEARRLPAGDDRAAREFFEHRFVPVAATNHGEAKGLLTGYYEPELRGSRVKKGAFRYPLYLAPDDRQVIDLGDFKRDLAGRKITGIVRGGRFRPYWDRGEIERGALRGRRLEFLWVDDPVTLFFLQIQGSGRVVLPDGSLVRVGYSGQNGHDYTAIGRVLIDAGELTAESVSLQSIRDWLRAHPERAGAVMDRNRSYVFFRVLPGESPEGSSGVELTAGRSLAIDDAFLPYGVPVWIDSVAPAIPAVPSPGNTPTPPTPPMPPIPSVPLRRLVVAQDTGGAITGPVRGDLFLGPGREAEELAGRMKQEVRFWLLLPRDAATLRAAGGA